MSTNHHTPVTTGAAANAATFNAPLSQLDTKITSQETAILLRSIVWAGKTAAPTVNDDTGDGIKVGDRWIDETNNQEYVAVDVTLGAAIWQQTTKTTNVSTYIDGLILTWDSATSVTVNKGACYAEDGSFIDVTSALVKSALSLTASTWYHVYVYLSAGTPTAEVVTTAPVSWKGNAYSKTGATSRRYVGSILADGSSNVRNFVHNGLTEEMLYRKFRSNTTPHRALNGGTATTATAVPLNGIVPVTALAAMIRITNLADKDMYTSEDNGVSSTQQTVALTAGNVAAQSGFLTHLVDSSQQIWYVYASAVGAGAGYLDVLGYRFKR
jgi:hypothetical protein